MHITATLSSSRRVTLNGPGGRHDNDFEDFRRIAIVPTVDELFSSEHPFLRFAAEIDGLGDDEKLATHLDNQFRLLREDMLRDLREELTGKTKRRGQRIDGLQVLGSVCEDKNKWAVVFKCSEELKFLPKEDPKDPQKRLRFLQTHKKILPHGSLVCILGDGKLVGLGELWRKEQEMADSNPRLYVHLTGNKSSTQHTLKALHGHGLVQLIQLNTALFAYDPILRQLQNTRLLPIADHILTWHSGQPTLNIAQSSRIQNLVSKIELEKSMDLQTELSLPKSTRLDLNQAQSLITGLTQEVALIQGPPGTGKSFIGALLAKALYNLSDVRILVLSYTNHALDQYLEDLMDVGISERSIVRLGSSAKASIRTKPLSLFEQIKASTDYKMTRTDWELIDSRKSTATSAGIELSKAFTEFIQSSVTRPDLFEYLEFSSDFSAYFEAFQVPQQLEGFTIVDEKSKSIDKYYLMFRCMRGRDAGVLQEHISDPKGIWDMKIEERDRVRQAWFDDIRGERARRVTEYGCEYDATVAQIQVMMGEKGRRLLRDRRVIGCTTTAAAKYVKDIQSAQPDVVIVEEAGEILEGHVLAALGPATKQLVLIGDHKQLRPKAHFDLSVEKGKGYDLNKSMFERLVLKGYPHQILSRQHRMRPEISAIVRALTYPDLIDAESTLIRPHIRGFQDSLIFVDHDVPENEHSDAYDPREGSATLTKRNDFEAALTLKCVKYIAQQGYGSDQIVVLTPYLGQLRLLYDVLQIDNDPVLNDLDSFDLIRAGLMPQATASMNQRRLRISTIDNYQGEESDIVVVSLTRSNKHGDIGFLSSPERLNVLVSRARDGLIIIGDSATFLQARNAAGRELWTSFFSLLKKGSHIYHGVPVRCERHRDQGTLIIKPEDFDHSCPDGGCASPCDAILSCGKHKCPQKCHQLYDHSKMKCAYIMADKCSEGHKLTWKCSNNRPLLCQTCEAKKKRDVKRLQQEHERRETELLAQQNHEARIITIEEQIEAERQRIQGIQLKYDRDKAYEQKKLDLAKAKELSECPTMLKPQRQPRGPTPGTSAGFNRVPETSQRSANTHCKQSLMEKKASAAARQWKQMQDLEGVTNDALDELMQMTGLESVKSKFINILEKLQTTIRQGTDLKQERMGTVMLGNPGTGKTTVARLYAKFLTEVGVIAGSDFVETTGAKLANEGVNATIKILEDLLKSGGGAVFIDEAYQLVSGNSHGGAAVLDYLLAEIENTTGKLVFIFAGYDRHMEKFFQYNPGLASRMPQRMIFLDYTETELLYMLQQKIDKKYKGRMQVEDGPGGLYMRVIIRRLHAESGREGFGNARSLENVLSKTTDAQSARITRERRSGLQPDDFWLSKEDIIGPEPSGALVRSAAWQELQSMVGLDSVKACVKTLLDRIQENYQRELKEKKPIQVSLNRLFLGSPGTGKTTVAKLYGQILADIGLLSTSECVVKTPADFIGSVIGESEQKTKAILDNTKGKVLVLDEAYMLCSGLGNTSVPADPYRTAVVDTIVSEVQSTPGEDRAVLLLGYDEQMREMLMKVNPGLSRRFPVDNAFMFEDYDDAQLLSIMNHKLKKQDLSATEEAKQSKQPSKRRPNFGNAGEVENLLSRAKDSFARRQQFLDANKRSDDVIFEQQDFDPNFDRGDGAITNIKELFGDVVGSEDVVSKLDGYATSYTKALELGMEPQDLIPFNFVFKGPPGTGKTTTARKIGKVFYAMGFLSSDNVVECSASNLIGEYVGQTGPKVIQKFDEALGQVLFIDEAYRFGEGPFAKEAIDELVDCLTKERYKSRMIVVLAGYEAEINHLLGVNPGLSSRFPEEIMFSNLDPRMCIQLIEKNLRTRLKVRNLHIDLNSECKEISESVAILEDLRNLSGWGNGRDIETIASRIASKALQDYDISSECLSIAWPHVLAELRRLQNERRLRDSVKPASTNKPDTLQPVLQSKRDLPSCLTSTSTATATRILFEDEEDCAEELITMSLSDQEDERDAGVSDAVWQQLQADKAAQDLREAEVVAALASEAKRIEELSRWAAQAIAEATEVALKASEDDEARRQTELQRIRAAQAKRDADAIIAREAKLREAQRQEAQVQQKLRQIGVCSQGFKWIKQTGGYRCAGGSHWVTDARLGL
ncbi:hypothetical protein LTR64_000665 [Lithohypha guttulata]|uniref:uncharacterized protein n=1 Tax=Lithohypha guttulata TaxID=1690604 RepID=UPI002DE03ECB|nr:hypothetical protein LTR51_005566 [Lithohypha guttulata]